VISDGHTPSFGADSAAKSGSRSVRIALDSLRQEFRDQKRGVKLEKGLLVGGCIRLIHMQLSARNNAHVETQRAKLCGSEDVNEGRGEGENGEALGELVVDVCLSHARMLLRLGRASQDGADGCKAYGSLDQAGTQKSGDVRAFGEEWRLLPASALVLSALTQHDKQPADWQQLSAAAHHPDPTDQHSSQTTFHPLSRAVLARAHDALLRLVDGKLLHLMAAMVVCALPAAPPLSPPSTFTRLLGGMASILNQMEAQLDDGGVMAFGAATCHVLRCPHLPVGIGSKAHNQSISCLVQLICSSQSLYPLLQSDPVGALVHAAQLPLASTKRLRSNSLKGLAELSGVGSIAPGLGSDPELWAIVVGSIRSSGSLSRLIQACTPIPEDANDVMSSGVIFVAALLNNSAWARHCVFGSQDGCEDGGFSAGTEDVSEEMGALIAGMVSHPGTADELMDSESDLRDTFFRQMGRLLANKKIVQRLNALRALGPLAKLMLTLPPEWLLGGGDHCVLFQVLRAIASSLSAMEQVAEKTFIDALQHFSRTKVQDVTGRMILKRVIERLILASQRST